MRLRQIDPGASQDIEDRIDPRSADPNAWAIPLVRVEPRADPRGQVLDLLARALPGAAESTFEALADEARVLVLEPGELVWREGSPSPLTLQISGYTAFRRTTADGRLLVSSIARPGLLFGYAGVAGQAAAGDLVTLTQATVALWPAAWFRELVSRDPGLALSVIDAMGRYLVFITARIDRFMHQDASGRVLRALAEYGELFFGEAPILSRSLLPGIVGTSREMTGRVLRSLEAQGVIARVGRRGLLRLSSAALNAIVEAAGDGS